MTDRKDAATPERTTLVEEGTELRGAITSTCPILVRGSIDGEVTAPSLSVSATGGVRGTVKVRELRSEGEIAGEIDAEIVTLSGRVKDSTVIRARSLEVKLASEEGQMEVMFGECRLDVGDMPEKVAETGVIRADKRSSGDRRRGRESVRVNAEPAAAPFPEVTTETKRDSVAPGPS